MPRNARLIAACVAIVYAGWAEATLMRHWAGLPDAGMKWLLISPALGAFVVLIGVGLELAGRAGRAVSLGVQLAGMALLSWRSLWMFFSWDGMLLFPVWCLAALSTWPRRLRRPTLA